MIALLDNVVQTIVTIIAGTICTTEYVRTRHKSFQYMGVTLWFYVLGIYYWTAYLVVMGDLPDTILFADLAFIASLACLIPTLYFARAGKRLLRFHPFLLPVVLLSLALYVFVYYRYSDPFAFALLTALAGVVMYVSLLGFLDAKKEGRAPSVFAAALMLVLCEHICWVCDLFFTEPTLSNPYYWFDTMITVSFLLSPFALTRSLNIRHTDEANAASIRRRILFNVVFALVISVLGVLLGLWMRNSLQEVTGSGAGGRIIAVVLFVFSLMVVLSIMSIMVIAGMQIHFRESDALRDAKAKAEQASEAKSRFLADMSHEIRTPINAVLGMNEMILRESESDRITTYARNVESAGKNLLSIINDILDFSKIEAGKMEITEAPYKLSSVLNDVSNMITFRAHSKDLKFFVEVDRTIPDRLLGDEVRVRQIITNLLTNGVKYTVEGSVTLTVSAERKGERNIDLVIAVKDTGIGIREEDIGTIFTKFGRVDLQQTNTIEGTGLGLAITESLLLMMGGDIRVESVYGEGSVFTVRLPQGVVSKEAIGDFHRRFEEGLKTLGTYHESFHAPDAHVLAVDDTELNLVVIEGLLKATEVKLDLASGGEEALQLCKDTPYDLILLDQRMPHMSGTETLRHIRAQEGGCNNETPVICLTADAVQGARERYLKEGFSDYLSKPVEGHALEAVLTAYLPAGKVVRVVQDGGSAPGDAPRLGDAGLHGRRHAAAPQEVREEPSSLQSAYKAIPSLDYGEAKRLLVTDELIEKTLRSFYGSIFENAASIEACMREEDYQNYTIRVHALKSSARMIGATNLSALAERLEECGNVLQFSARKALN